MFEDFTLKLNAGQEKPADDNSEAPSSPTNDIETQMRRALGLYGRGPKLRPEQEHRDPTPPTKDRSNGPARRRFVQDGEVPVTVVRRDSSADAGSSSPLQRAEAALAAEVAARKNTERLLTDVQAQIRDLQTKIGHAELARAEAAETSRRDRDIVAELRAAGEEEARAHRKVLERIEMAERNEAKLKTSLREERSARTAAEAALAAAEDARRSAQAALEDLINHTASPRSAGRAAPSPSPSPARKPGRPAVATRTAELAPEPVKWWLTPSKPTKRRPRS